MPVDPASLVALSGLAVRDLPDDAELIAETGPAAPTTSDGPSGPAPDPAPAADPEPVDVAAPFWMEPLPGPSQALPEEGAAPAAAHQQEQVTDVGIGLVAVSPEVVDPATQPPGRPSLPSLASLSLASRAFAAKHLPEAPLAALRDVSLDLSSLHPSAWRLPDLGTFPTLDAPARRRLALLAGSSMAAGLAAGLAVPVAAEAAPAPTAGTAPTPSPEATEAALLAAPSPFARLTAAAAARSDAAPATPAVQPAAAKPAPAKAAPAKAAPAKAGVAKPTAAKPTPAKPTPAKPAPAKPTAAGPATPVPAAPAAPAPDPVGAPSGDGAAALVATLLVPAGNPFAESAPAPGVGPVATEPPHSVAGTAAPAGAAPAAAPTASVAVPAASPAASLPGRTSAAAVVVVTDPPAPHPGRPAPAATPAPVTPVWKATRPLPAHSGTGRRIVYAERSAHLWIVGADGTVLRDYKVTGRADRPKPGSYKVFSKSRTTSNPKEKLTFDLMVRFTRGVTGAAIGFHTIPKTYSGHPIQSEKDLGRAIGMGGCVRQSRVDAEWLYAWSRVGDTVVVLH